MTDAAFGARAASVLTLPGWQSSGEAHWQSHWERLHGFRRVEQDDWIWPRRGDWMARLDDVVLDTTGPCCLVAHSLGCQLIAAWAAHSQHTSRIAGALLVAPPDTERADMPPQLHGWRPIARQPLPFPATVVVSTDDPFASPERTAEMAEHWHATLVSIGHCGHINAASGLGDWLEGQQLLADLMTDPMANLMANLMANRPRD